MPITRFTSTDTDVEEYEFGEYASFYDMQTLMGITQEMSDAFDADDSQRLSRAQDAFKEFMK